MANKLKIYACSGIGDAAEVQPAKYWTDDTNTLRNTQAVNSLLAQINLRWSEVNHLQLSHADKLNTLNDMDVLLVGLDAAKRYAKDADKLQKAGAVIGTMIADGAFESASLNMTDRANNLDGLIDQMNEAVFADDETKATDEWLAWWQSHVMARNKYGLTEAQANVAQKALKKAVKQIKGIGAVDWNKYNDGKWLENADLAEMLTAGSDYFLYTYFTDAQLAKLPKVFKAKQLKQRRTYNYCKQLFVDAYGTEQDMQAIILAGIYDSMEQTPEEFCTGIVNAYENNETEKIGAAGVFTFLGLVGKEAIEALIALLGVIATLLGTIINAICTCVKDTNVAKYGALDREIVNSSTPNQEDYDGLNMGGLSIKSVKDILPIVALAAGALLLLKN